MNYAQKNSIHRASEEFGVERKSIRNWIQNLPELIASENKSKKFTVHSGKKAETDSIEAEIVEWILMNRSLGVAVSSWEVIIKACNLKEDLKQKSVSSLQKWCYRFLTRNLLTFRSGTHVGQSLPEHYPEAMKKFIKFNENLRKDNDFSLTQIANMDETSLFMNMTSTKTIAKIGSKEVNIKTHGQERVHVTAILWIVADGTKLPPVLVFKGKPFGRVEKRIQKHPLVKSEQIFAYCQKKAWNNETIMKKWIIDVWRKYTYFDLKKNTMLVLDDASMHKIKEVKEQIESWNTHISLIPGGLTRYLQPLDISIKKTI